MRNLSRLILKLDENLTELTLVYDSGVFSLYSEDKKSKTYNEREIKAILAKIDATALDFQTPYKRDVERMVTTAKTSPTKQVDISGDEKEVKKLRLS